jgi:hypothetical protein
MRKCKFSYLISFHSLRSCCGPFSQWGGRHRRAWAGATLQASTQKITKQSKGPITLLLGLGQVGIVGRSRFTRIVDSFSACQPQLSQQLFIRKLMTRKQWIREFHALMRRSGLQPCVERCELCQTLEFTRRQGFGDNPIRVTVHKNIPKHEFHRLFMPGETRPAKVDGARFSGSYFTYLQNTGRTVMD